MTSRGAVTPLLGRRSECEKLDRLLADARDGDSRALVVRGVPGVGKTALLEYLTQRATDCRVVQVAGVESEMELPYAGLQQLCAPVLEGMDGIPAPQRDAVGVAFGLTAGPPPDRFLIGLGALYLLAEASERQPLVCVIDDAQWLDRISLQTIVFLARRLMAERIAVVIAVRVPSEVPVLDEPPRHGRAVEDEEGNDDAPGVPARLSGDGQRLALIERDAPLDRTKVVQLGLRLFDQERSVCLPEGEKVDPASWWTDSDRDLGSRDPARPLQPACDVAGQPGMDRVVLPPTIAEVAGIELERSPDTERGEHALGGAEIEVARRATLDAPDGRVRGLRSNRQLALGPANEVPSFTHRVGELGSEAAPVELEGRVRHRPFIAPPACRSLISTP